MESLSGEMPVPPVSSELLRCIHVVLEVANMYSIVSCAGIIRPSSSTVNRIDKDAAKERMNGGYASIQVVLFARLGRHR